MFLSPMTIHLNSQADLDNAIRALVRQDPRLKAILERTGMPALRQREPGFAGLAAIITGQQVSTASAAAIWGRVSAAFDPFHHDALRRARADRLGRLGLSGAKIKTLKNLARELAAERLNLEVLAEPWRPLRGAAAHLWWAYYKVLKARDGVIAGQQKSNAVLNTPPVAKPTSAKAKIAAAKTGLRKTDPRK